MPAERKSGSSCVPLACHVHSHHVCMYACRWAIGSGVLLYLKSRLVGIHFC
jgi:hypothetical protein